MPKAIGEFFNELAQKAGIPADDKSLKDLLASPELINIKVSDELVTSLDKGLINIDQAKNNHPDIKKKYFADAYDGIDSQLSKILSDEAADILTPEDLTEIAAEKSTTKKMGLALTKLKAAKVKASPADKEAINKQLNELNEALRVEKEGKKKLVDEYEGKIKDIHLNSALTGMFGNYKTIYDDIPGNVKATSLKAMITQALQDNDAVLKVDDNGTLAITRKDGTNVFGSDNRQLTPQSFLDKTFAPILKVSTPQKVTQTPKQAVNTDAPANNEFISSYTQKMLESIPQ